MRRYLILVPGTFLSSDGKTAHGVIRYSRDTVVAVVDPDVAGKSVREVLPHLNCDAPIVASVRDGLGYEPTALLIGTAPMGGRLPPDWREEIRTALRAGLEVVSGLHQFLSEDAELSAEAAAHHATIFDVRRVPEVPLFSGAAYQIAAPILLTVGNECAVGKMTVSLEIAAAARKGGKRAVFVPTGQTGIMIAGWGIAVDRVISDFASGAAEQLVLEVAREDPDLIVVEGQGAINNPAYGSVTLSLLFGTAPDALLLCCNPQLTTMESFDIPVLSYRQLIRIYEATCATVKPARVAGIALNTGGMTEIRAIAEIERARAETGLPADDVVRFGANALYEAIEPGLRKHESLAVTPA
jgi:uncharacterized NAD-dependent epimerase/dehydratase family protein